MGKKAKHTRPPGFTKSLAEFWRVSERVAQLWLARGLPLDDAPKMVAWYAALPASRQSKITPAFRARIIEVREQSARPGQSADDPDFLAFRSAYTPEHNNDQTALASLKEDFAFYLYKKRQCTARGDGAAASEAMNQVKAIGDVIHDMELRAKTLGRDLGDLVPRRLLESPARHLAYHLLRCADALRAEIVATLTRRDPAGAPLTAAELDHLLSPILLNSYVLQPILRAAEGDNSGAPPDWLVAALRAGLADVLETNQAPP